MLPTPDEMRGVFALMDDWELRYSYVIDLGRMLPEMPVALKVEDVLVRGCTSRVWLVAESVVAPDGQKVFHFQVDSDAAIVKGLCAVLMVLVQGRSGAEITATDMRAEFEALGLAQNLSPNRRNGFFAMVERIRALAT